MVSDTLELEIEMVVSHPVSGEIRLRLSARAASHPSSLDGNFQNQLLNPADSQFLPLKGADGGTCITGWGWGVSEWRRVRESIEAHRGCCVVSQAFLQMGAQLTSS